MRKETTWLEDFLAFSHSQLSFPGSPSQQNSRTRLWFPSARTYVSARTKAARTLSSARKEKMLLLESLIFGMEPEKLSFGLQMDAHSARWVNARLVLAMKSIASLFRGF
jgi:hypothetical protein